MNAFCPQWYHLNFNPLMNTWYALKDTTSWNSMWREKPIQWCFKMCWCWDSKSGFSLNLICTQGRSLDMCSMVWGKELCYHLQRSWRIWIVKYSATIVLILLCFRLLFNCSHQSKKCSKEKPNSNRQRNGKRSCNHSALLKAITFTSQNEWTTKQFTWFRIFLLSSQSKKWSEGFKDARRKK